jgi:hypothetical protein
MTLWAKRRHRFLFDHLVGASEYRGRQTEADCLRRFEIDDQLVFCRSLDRQIGRLLAFQDAIDAAR